LRNEELPEMAAEATTATSTGLRRNVLTLPQVSFQGIAHIAPSINVVFTFPVIALKAGPTMPISFLLTTIVCVFIANTGRVGCPARSRIHPG
jgi:amino acid transporter